MQRALIVSIHDVAPATHARVKEIVEELADLGVPVSSLLVVPDYHRHGCSMADAGFCAWLQERQAVGHEIVLHGFHHERARQPDETARDKFITRFYTADEGEFYNLSYNGARELLDEAQRDFAGSDFNPRGFVAPAWLLGREAERAVIDAGFTYTTTLRQVRDFVARREYTSQTLVYSVRSSWRRGVSLGWNRYLFSRLMDNGLLRLSLHPPDITYPAIWRQISGIIAEVLQDRAPTTYAKWLQDCVIPSEAEGSRGASGKLRTESIRSFLNTPRDRSTPPAAAGFDRDDESFT